MIRLGIVVALAAEARTLGLRGPRFEIITTADSDVMVSVSGIGARQARSAGQHLLAHGANALLSWGTAVALDSALGAGQLLLPRQVLQADLTSLPVSAEWRQQLCDRLQARFSVNEQPLITTEMVLARPKDKRRLHVESGAVAADMESASIGLLARDAGVPFAVLRTIADTVATRFPAWTTDIIDEYGRLRRSGALLQLFSHPADWLNLFGLAMNFRSALITLNTVHKDGGFTHLKPVSIGNQG